MRLALLFIPLVCFFFFKVFSFVVWFFLWLPEEVLTLLFLLHRENRDFSILMKDILSVMTESSHFFWKHDRNSGCRFLNNVCPNFAHFIYLCTLTVQNDEVSGESWQLVTVIYDEGDGLIFLNFSYKVMTIIIPGMLVLVLLELTLWLPSR